MTGLLFPATKPRFLSKPAGGEAPTVVWEFDRPRPTLSSASVGGGLRPTGWVLNIGVPLKYSRTDLAVHATEIATSARLRGDGAALFTAADTTRIQHEECDGLRVDTTVGISKPTWAADDDNVFTDWTKPHHPKPGTINIVVQLPVSLTDAAAVNAIITVTEAKTQALIEAGVPGTGTASDAVVICWAPTSTDAASTRDNGNPTDIDELNSGPISFMGPRSEWGSRVARAVHDTVARGIITGGWVPG